MRRRYVEKKGGPARYVIKPQPIPKLLEILATKAGIKPPDPPKSSKGGNVLSPPLAGSGAEPPKGAAPESETKARLPRGMAELQKILAGQWAISRVQKAQWQQRLMTRDRKQSNRMSRVRSA